MESARRPDNPPNRGVALAGYLIPVVCSVLGDKSCVEQNDEVVCGTPRRDMVRGWRRLFYKAHRLKPIWFLTRACACGSHVQHPNLSSQGTKFRCFQLDCGPHSSTVTAKSPPTVCFLNQLLSQPQSVCWVACLVAEVSNFDQLSVVERKMPWSTARSIEVSGPRLEKPNEATRYEHASPTTWSFTHC